MCKFYVSVEVLYKIATNITTNLSFVQLRLCFWLTNQPQPNQQATYKYKNIINTSILIAQTAGNTSC